MIQFRENTLKKKLAASSPGKHTYDVVTHHWRAEWSTGLRLCCGEFRGNGCLTETAKI